MSILTKHRRKILWIFIILYIIIFSTICIWKYYNLGYNSLDLAIINQVFYNTAHGHPFASSIHAPSYLGDHFNPIIFLLLPFYLIYQSPITLLILQVIIIALAAWPLYLISKNVFKDPKYYLLFPLIFLLNPFVQNANLFEFHFLPLAYFLIFFAFYFYQKNKFWPFLTFIILSLLVREDVALFIFCFGLFILINKLLNKACLPKHERRQEKIKIHWVLTPLILSIVYFFLSLKIISCFNPDAGYKFLIYYAWLGESLPEIAKNLLCHPWLFITSFFRQGNLEMTLAFLLPFAFLPLFRPRYLILALATFIQLTISNLGASALIIKLHYSVLLCIPLFLASIYALKCLKQKKRYQSLFPLVPIILLLATIYSLIALGPRIVSFDQEKVSIKKEMLSQIPPQASVISTYEFLTPLSNREQIYSLNYSFLGKKQLSSKPYVAPTDVEYILADLSETITYQLQYENLSFYQENYYQGAENLRQLLEENNYGLIKLTDTIALFHKDSDSIQQLFTIHNFTPRDMFNCHNPIQDKFSCSLQFASKPNKNYQMELELKKDEKTVYSRLIPIASGLYTTYELNPDQIINTYHSLSLPEIDFNTACLNLVEIYGDISINRLGSISDFIQDKYIIKSNCFPF